MLCLTDIYIYSHTHTHIYTHVYVHTYIYIYVAVIGVTVCYVSFVACHFAKGILERWWNK